MGQPNVGKSSLMNRLLGRDRAIVTPIPGTTRDVLEDRLTLNGVPVILSDTAGWRDTDDPVERMGIEKARAAILDADLLLLVTDATAPPRNPFFFDSRFLHDRPLLWVINKIDLAGEEHSLASMPDILRDVPMVGVSAITGEGMEALRQRIHGILLSGDMAAHHGAIPNLRHQRHLRIAQESLERAERAIEEQFAMEAVSIDLSEALTQLENILGLNGHPDLLDRVFQDFCIGK